MSKRRKAQAQFQDQYARMYPGKQVKNVTFIVTHQCNLRCTYCYEHNKSEKKMTLETGKRCVDLLFEEDSRDSELINERAATALVLDFIGGEPFLEVELIDQIVSYFLTKAMELGHRWATHYMISLSTNGTLGDDPRVKKFLAKYQGRVSVGVTIDGDKEAHDACRVDLNGNGSYDRAIKMYREVSNGGRKSTKYTIAPGNIEKFADAVRHLVLEEGINDLHCNCVYEEGWTIEHARELYRQCKQVSDMLREEGGKAAAAQSGSEAYVSILDWDAGEPMPESETQNWCGGAGQMLAFDVDGTILPCMRYSSVSIPEERQPLYRIGDLKSGIANREDDVKRLRALQEITRQSQSEPECLKCPIASGCAWCTAYNYEMTGTPNKRVTYICEMHKARVLAQCYHHNKWHLKDPEHEAKKMHIPREWAVAIIGEEEYKMLLELEKRCVGGE